jgi:hypothetical protein
MLKLVAQIRTMYLIHLLELHLTPLLLHHSSALANGSLLPERQESYEFDVFF